MAKRLIIPLVMATLAVSILASLAWRSHMAAQKAVAAALKDSAEATTIDFPFLDRALVQSAGQGTSSVKYPPDLARLDNRRVTLVGFMAPYEQIDDMRRFLLLPSYVGCFFCAPPSFTQVLLVEQRPVTQGKLPFINDPVLVTGTLRLYSKTSQHPAHKAEFVYALDDANVMAYHEDNAPVRAVATHTANRGQTTKDGKPAYGNPLSHTGGTSQDPADLNPQSFITVATDLRKLPMLRAIHFEMATPEELISRLSENISRQRGRSQWRASAKACLALGLSESPFEMPRVLASLGLRHKAGFYDPSTDTVYYLKSLKFSPDAKLQLLQLILEALIEQNHPLPPSLSDDALLATLTFRWADAALMAKKFTASALPPGSSKPEVTVSVKGMDPPDSLKSLADLLYQQGSKFVREIASANQVGSLEEVYSLATLSTADILFPERYRANLQRTSRDVPLSANSASTAVSTGEMGCALLSIWTGTSDSLRLMEGWKGDYYQIWENNAGGYNWVVRTQWKDESSARSFFSSLRDHFKGASPSDKTTQFRGTANGKKVWAKLNNSQAEVAMASAPTEDEANKLLEIELPQ